MVNALNCFADTVFQDSGGAVLHGIHDRYFGIMDEYFMARWTGIQLEMLLAVDTIHTITQIPMPWYFSSPWNVSVKWSEDPSMFPEKENSEIEQGEAVWLSYQ